MHSHYLAKASQKLPLPVSYLHVNLVVTVRLASTVAEERQADVGSSILFIAHHIIITLLNNVFALWRFSTYRAGIA